MELGDTILDPDTFLNDPEDIIEICGSLITLDLGIGTISLAHFSVKEFFVSSSGRHPDFVINPVQVNFELAKLCVTYLSFDHFRDGPCASGNELEERFKSYALYSYACSKWPKHAKGHDSMNDDDFLSVVGGFFQDPDLDGNFVAWTQAYHAIPTVHTAYNLGEFWDSYFTHDSEGETNRLVYACRFGIYSLSKLLILSGIDPSAVCTSQKKDEALKTSESNACGNALNAACLSGDIKVVDLILSSGVDINAIAGKHELALIAAIVKCHDRLGPRGPRDYRLLGHLLGKGASVHIMTPRKSWPLYEAGNKGCFEAVKLFLDAGADVSIRHFYLKMTVFEISAIFGRREIFEILRQHGGGKYISPDMQELNLNTSIDGYGLFFASKSNFFESAKKILETDGEKIFKDPSYELLMHHTFLECASNGYYKFLEQMLVYSGNTFSAYVDCCKSAASQGHPKTLGVLLDIKGAKIDDILLGNMMVTAAGRGHQGVVNELMERGVRPFATNEHGWTVMLATALSAAQLQVQDSTLLVLQGTGHGFEKLEHSVLRPSCWKLRPNKDEPFQPNLITKGTSAYLPPGLYNALRYITIIIC